MTKPRLVYKPAAKPQLSYKAARATLSTGGQIAEAFVPRPVYDGATTFTPASSQQVVQTEGKAVLSNIIIEPIPNNYGLITWNGSVLTVS